MKLNISEVVGNTTLFGKKYPANFATEKGMEKAEVNLSWPLGRSRFLEHWFEGMHVTEAELFPDGSSTLKIQTVAPVYILLFCLQGKLSGKAYGRQTSEFELNPREGVFLPIPSYSLEVSPHKRAKTICIRLTTECYGRLSLKDSERELIDNTPVFKMTPAMQLIISSLLESRYPEAMRRISMEAKILELLFLLLTQQCTVGSPLQLTPFQKNDIESIHFARRLIEQNIRRPYSIIELARKVGLNDFKLKKGFKQVWGTTVFGYLNDIRMERAKQLLIDEKRTVHDVSDQVGYKNPHHFTAAFKKRYGILPSHLNK